MDPNQMMAQALMQQQAQGMGQIPTSQLGMLAQAPAQGLGQVPVSQFGSNPHGSISVDPRTGRLIVHGM